MMLKWQDYMNAKEKTFTTTRKLETEVDPFTLIERIDRYGIIIQLNYE